MLIAQISDTHISAQGEQAYSAISTAEHLASCIDHLNGLTPRPDLVIITGDISYSDQPAEYRRAADLFNQLDMPWFVIPGNHDSGDQLLAAVGSVHCPVAQNDLTAGFINYVIDDYPLRLIALDSTRAGDHPGGEVCTARAAWLEQQLSQHPDRPTLIFTHHPPLKMGVLETDRDGFIGAERLGAIVQKYRCIERLLCGHVHLPMFAGWRGAIVSTAPSIGLQLRLDLTMELPSQFYVADPACQLHHWTAEHELITHTLEIRQRPGPYPFE